MYVDWGFIVWMSSTQFFPLHTLCRKYMGKGEKESGQWTMNLGGLWSNTLMGLLETCGHKRFSVCQSTVIHTFWVMSYDCWTYIEYLSVRKRKRWPVPFRVTLGFISVVLGWVQWCKINRSTCPRVLWVIQWENWRGNLEVDQESLWLVGLVYS